MDLKNNKPYIMPGCIGCGLCQFVCPEVFQVSDVSYIKEHVDYELYRQSIEKAAQECPMHVIVFDKKEV